MDYEKEYKEMVQRAKELHESENALTKQQMEIVCPELAESEDERIREQIEQALIEHDWSDTYKVSKDDCLTYLERQKEQEPITTSRPFNPDDYKVVENDNATELRRKQKEQRLAFTWRRVEDVTTKRTDEGDCVTTEKILVKGLIDDEDYRIIDKDVMVNKNLLCIPVRELSAEQKSPEWSEEDERMLEGIIERGSSQIPFHEPALRGEQMEWLMNRLKSLRSQPHWKPSEEQMYALAARLDTTNKASIIDNNYNNNQTVNIKPACVGLLQKSHPKSFFTYCHVNSDYRKEHIDDNQRVLQVMVFGDGHMLVEILPNDVYNEWLNGRK